MTRADGERCAGGYLRSQCPNKCATQCAFAYLVDDRAETEARLRAENQDVRVLEDRDGGLHVVTVMEIYACKLTPQDMAEAKRLAARDKLQSAGKAPCSCPSPDPFGMMVDGVECCLTCGGHLKSKPLPVPPEERGIPSGSSEAEQFPS